MTRLVMEGRLKSEALLHPALGRYYKCEKCDAIFEVDDLGAIHLPVRLEPDFWGHVRCPFCQEWFDLTPKPASPPKQMPWVADWLTLGVVAALIFVLIVFG